MRRLAMGAVLGAIAFASPTDAGLSGAVQRSTARAAPRVEVTVAGGGDWAPPAPSTTTSAPPTTVPARVEAARASRSRAGPGSSGEGVWRALAMCESNGNPRAVSKTGKYRGAFQFSIPTWRSLGYGGDPIDHPYAVQLAAAKRLQARSGWGQWPACSRRLGLR